MVFSSIVFLCGFLPIVLALHSVTGPAGRNALLLLASVIFYAWGEGAFVGVMLVLIAINWIAGLAIQASADQRRRSTILAGAVVLNLGNLVYFKYTHFIVGSVTVWIAGSQMPPSPPDIHLPLGISFFTFHLLSYIVDIYRRTAQAQTKPLNFGLYVAFFPQLVAGPIIRYHDVESQLTDRRVTLALFASGIERFTLGLGKKVLLANPFGEVADRVFALGAADLSTPVAWLGIAAYTLQIYFDFSGYSDMAIGLARMFGFRFLENFNYPYIARSMRDFWRRWHISLSNWFRDYLYIPLGGNRHGTMRTSINLLVVFVLCGLWHGASWNFLVWGLLHGGFLGLERLIPRHVSERVPGALRHLYVLLVVMVAWVFFRAETLPAATTYLSTMFGFHNAHADAASIWAFLDVRVMFLAGVGVAACTPVFSVLARDWRRDSNHMGAVFANVEGPITVIRPVAMAVILVLALAYLAGQTYNPFIYFRF